MEKGGKVPSYRQFIPIIGFLFVFCFIISLYALSSSWLKSQKINKVVISGLEFCPKSYIDSLIKPIIYTECDLYQIKSRLDKLPFVSNSTLFHSEEDAMIIEINERKPLFKCFERNANNFLYFDSLGTKFFLPTEKPLPIPTVILKSNMLADGKILAELINFVMQLQNCRLYNHIATVEITGNAYVVTLKPNLTKMLFSRGNNIFELDNAKGLVESFGIEKIWAYKTIDFRFTNVAIR